MVHTVEIKWHPVCIVHTTVYISASLCVCLCVFERDFCRTLFHRHLLDEGGASWAVRIVFWGIFA